MLAVANTNIFFQFTFLQQILICCWLCYFPGKIIKVQKEKFANIDLLSMLDKPVQMVEILIEGLHCNALKG